MHFNIYLDDDTGQQLNAASADTGESRNALIRKAVSDWLARQGQPQWPDIVRNHTGMEGMPLFEAGRDKLAAPADDPLA